MPEAGGLRFSRPGTPVRLSPRCLGFPFPSSSAPRGVAHLAAAIPPLFPALGGGSIHPLPRRGCIYFLRCRGGGMHEDGVLPWDLLSTGAKGWKERRGGGVCHLHQASGVQVTRRGCKILEAVLGGGSRGSSGDHCGGGTTCTRALSPRVAPNCTLSLPGNPDSRRDEKTFFLTSKQLGIGGSPAYPEATRRHSS